MTRTIIRLGLAAGAAAALAACADDSYYGRGYGYPVGTVGGYYSGPVGYGGEYFAGLGYPTYGFYNDWYYPGYGVYVFDRAGHRRAWNDDERRHWEYHGQMRGNHLMENGRFNRDRDRAYLADRSAAFHNYRQNGGPARGGEHRRP